MDLLGIATRLPECFNDVSFSVYLRERSLLAPITPRPSTQGIFSLTLLA
ncbi:hypothetical protein [Synechococcus sp. M16CYN]